jgi:hypothetical protein
MAQTASRRPFTTEAWVRTRVNPRGICGGQNGTGTDFSQSSLVFHCQYHSTVALHAHTSSGGRTIRDIVSPHRHEQCTLIIPTIVS